MFYFLFFSWLFHLKSDPDLSRSQSQTINWLSLDYCILRIYFVKKWMNRQRNFSFVVFFLFKWKISLLKTNVLAQTDYETNLGGARATPQGKRTFWADFFFLPLFSNHLKSHLLLMISLKLEYETETGRKARNEKWTDYKKKRISIIHCKLPQLPQWFWFSWFLSNILCLYNSSVPFAEKH